MVNSNKLTAAQQAILTTLLYSDIFSFPLTKSELWKFLITSEKITQKDVTSCLHHLEVISYRGGYYCLKNHEAIITRRIKNLSEVEKKMQLARETARELSTIPTILFIGISGGLAVGNADKDDDVDFVIITKKNMLFTTRLFILFRLQKLGVRRSRNQKDAANTICANLLFDETVLTWPLDKRDIYTAREIAQLYPLFERNAMYSHFLRANSWIKKFLPNVSAVPFTPVASHADKRMEFTTILFFNAFFETVFRFLQLCWMRQHQTREVLTQHVLALHPNDYGSKTLKQLRLKMRQLGLLTKF